MEPAVHQTGITLTGELEHDLFLLKEKFDRCSDIVCRTICSGNQEIAVAVYLDGLVDDMRIESELIKPLMSQSELFANPGRDAQLELPLHAIAHADQFETTDHIEDATTAVCKGATAVLISGVPQIHLAYLKKWEQRAVEEPITEAVIRGPRDGFIENLRVNTTLIRRRLPTADLKMEPMQVGRISRTELAIVYLDSIVMPGLVDEIKSRISRIDMDAVLESGYIEEMICDSHFTIFPQMISTERPDRVAASILEGRAAIIVDNTPFVLIAPSLITDVLQANEDYYQNFIVSTIMRWLRLILTFCALTFPSIFIAVSTFHQEMIPTTLLLSIASSRENVPFPALVEALLMEAAFEALREAGIRLPRPAGQAVSIVGALVIGQAAVQAGIVSATLIIVVSFTGIASFIFPLYNQGLAIRMLRFPLMLMAGMLGLYGIFLGLLLLLAHLCKLRSFGVPYLTPLSPLHVSDLKDVFVRAPWTHMTKRPAATGKVNRRRMVKLPPRPEPPV
ncbi:spore germination protein [Paenibacillus protaetiae]|uniref:Spore germination protein n=1 Tax=Paenibacillus protaetiae TaxID=2509456 RepID=A0A4V0YEY9_9BACL|nr:spore germination protein [Paenibacillus protaetiae]QAY65871.1 spore germination protein [Paenibacillus protaetiae]